MTVQPRYQNLFVYGCSLTKDNYIDTWADLLSNQLGCKLYNFAERGAGYTYIIQKLYTSFVNNPDTLCIIMWPSADRLDLYVNSAVPHLQNDIEFASWLDGYKAQFVDYNNQYNNQHGWYINGAVPRGYKNQYYKYFYNQSMHVNSAWATILSAQYYLDSIGANYIMCNSYPITNLIQYHDDGVKDFNFALYNKINLTKFVRDADCRGFINLSIEQKFKFFNPHYPDADAHAWYVDNYLMPII
jgi:hypothetical protein